MCLLHQHPLIYDMARGDMTFALKVEETLKDVSSPEYRQIVVEVRLWDAGGLTVDVSMF